MFFVKDPFTDNVTGPLGDSKLKQLATDGKIDASWEISRSREGPWQSVGKVKGLSVKRGLVEVNPTESPRKQEARDVVQEGARGINDEGEPASDYTRLGRQSVTSAAQSFRAQFESVRRSHFTSPASALDIFDWKFKKYLTPWILRITWAVVLCVGPLFIAVQLLQIIGIWLPDLNWTADGRPDIGARLPQGTPQPMLPWWLQIRVARTVWEISRIAGTAIAILWIRVLLELAIVLFNIATTLTSIETGLKERNPQD